ILGVFPYCQASPYQMVRPLMNSLKDRGHNVTLISPMGMFEDIQGVRHLRVPMINQQMQDIMDSDQMTQFFSGKWSEAVMCANIFQNMSHAILSDAGVQRMMLNKSESFDLVMLEASHLDALYGLAEFYNATLMGVSGVSTDWYIDYLAGNSAPSVYDPVSPMGFSLDNSLLGMIQNWIYIAEEQLLNRLVYKPSQLSLFKEFFGYSAQKMEELRSSFSVMLINNHFSTGRARANGPNIIEVGGLHLSEVPEQCDEELLRFLDEAEHGVIYFSMGQDILVNYLPIEIQEPLLQTLSKLNQRVVWKYDHPKMANKTDNMYVMVKTPQRKILDHPNVRLFITHGGLMSVMESIYSGVPMLGLPHFYDQFGNMHRVQKAGMAEVLDCNSLTTDLLTSTIHELLENPKYTIRAKEMSQSFRDRPMSPLDTAVWWTEYVLRHPDARLIRLDEQELSFMRYYRLDNLLSIALRFGFLTGSLVLIISKLFKKYREMKRRSQERTIKFRLIR
ncbi:hypothetical protein KR018_010144, partial [Drosophila ironensis]